MLYIDLRSNDINEEGAVSLSSALNQLTNLISLKLDLSGNSSIGKLYFSFFSSTNDIGKVGAISIS